MRSPWAERALLAAVVSTIAVYLFFEVYDLDVWFHLAIGRTILAGEGIPRVDSWTVAGLGRPYHDSHWLFQAAAAVAYAVGGFGGVQLLTFALWGVALAAVWAATSRAPLGIRALLVLVAAMASSERFLPRPEAVTALMVAVFLLLLGTQSWRSWRGLALLGVLEIVWVNAHGLFVLGPALVACTAAPGLVAWARGRGPSPVAEARLVTVVTLATLVGPSGLDTWRYAVLLAGEATGRAGAQVVGQVTELAPALSRDVVLAPAFWFFAPLAITGLGALVAGYRRGTVAPERGLQAALLLALALLGRRNMALAALALPPIIADGLPFRAWSLGRLRTGGSVLACAAVASWAGLGVSGAYSERLRWLPARCGFGITESYFPHHLPAVLRSVGVDGPLYASASLGGFLEFHGFRPLFDGRWEVQDPPLLDAIAAAPSDPPSFERLVAHYRLPALVLQHEAPDARALLPYLASQTAWRLVYWDAAASLWMRSDDPRVAQRSAPVVALSGGLRLFDHVTVDGFLESIGANAARVANLRAALELGGPMQEQLLGWLALALRDSGDLAGAEATTMELVRRRPSDVSGLIDLSVYSLRRGDRVGAEGYLVRALAAEPSNREVLRRLALVRREAPE
jgi:hypothetical protein